MAENERREQNGGFFLGAIFTAIIFFFLFFTSRFRGVGAAIADATGLGAGAGAGAAGGAGAAAAGGCTRVCDECDKALTPTPFAFHPKPPVFQGGFTETAGTSNTAPLFGPIGQIIDPYGGSPN